MTGKLAIGHHDRMVSRSTPANPSPSSLPTRRMLARQALPIILAGASVPLLGMVDTAVIGHYGSAAELGALAVGALLFNFLYWAFGFLRMATTGFVAQAAGGGQAVRLQAAVLRPLLLGLGIGLALWLLHAPLSLLFHAALGSTPALEARSDDYVAARIWGAPAALALYALCGSLIGLGRGGGLGRDARLATPPSPPRLSTVGLRRARHRRLPHQRPVPPQAGLRALRPDAAGPAPLRPHRPRLQACLGRVRRLFSRHFGGNQHDPRDA